MFLLLLIQVDELKHALLLSGIKIGMSELKKCFQIDTVHGKSKLLLLKCVAAVPKRWKNHIIGYELNSVLKSSIKMSIVDSN